MLHIITLNSEFKDAQTINFRQQYSEQSIKPKIYENQPKRQADGEQDPQIRDIDILEFLF